jgi:hypothetical protein
MDWYHQSERDETIRDAQASIGKSPPERFNAFVDLMATVEAILKQLPAEERLRRADIARRFDPLPDPWWKNFRPEAVAEYAATKQRRGL